MRRSRLGRLRRGCVGGWWSCSPSVTGHGDPAHAGFHGPSSRRGQRGQAVADRRPSGSSRPSSTSEAMQRSTWAGSGPAVVEHRRGSAGRGRRAAAWSTAPRTCRSVPCHAWPRRGGPSWAGRPAATQAHRSLAPGSRRTAAPGRGRRARRAPSPRRSRSPTAARVGGDEGCRQRGLGRGERRRRRARDPRRPARAPGARWCRRPWCGARRRRPRRPPPCRRRRPGSARSASSSSGTAPPCRSTMATAASRSRSARRG